MPTHYELIGVHKRYGEIDVLNDFNFVITQGSMAAIVGPSGAGKSTVLNIMGLIDAPDSGIISIFGNRAPKPLSRSANKYIRNHVGYLFQNFALIDDATVRDNLQIALTYVDNPVPREKLIADSLAKVGLPGIENRRVYSLSGGEQQRVAIARLLLKPCDVVLADEPTGSLDSANRDVVLSLLLDINAMGKTIIVATHDDAVVAACAQCVSLA